MLIDAYTGCACNLSRPIGPRYSRCTSSSRQPLNRRLDTYDRSSAAQDSPQGLCESVNRWCDHCCSFLMLIYYYCWWTHTEQCAKSGAIFHLFFQLKKKKKIKELRPKMTKPDPRWGLALIMTRSQCSNNLCFDRSLLAATGILNFNFCKWQSWSLWSKCVRPCNSTLAGSTERWRSCKCTSHLFHPLVKLFKSSECKRTGEVKVERTPCTGGECTRKWEYRVFLPFCHDFDWPILTATSDKQEQN